jgi:hypothetical protein
MNPQKNTANVSARKYYGTLIELAVKLIAELSLREKNPTKLVDYYLVSIRESTNVAISYVRDNQSYYSSANLEIMEKEFIRKYSRLIHKKKRGKHPQKTN